ncbi:hypothetical protein GRF29_19g1349200 [Pseudopithomyces chartarum]|uniref:Uncharacterized protein n=1 Tax=Pseudopithomyces chartarum TaxID=1892770 RepID=A0AAN6M1X1_9PLEO|nr:hypothetical protein GRF29_19g1349200 [Pseudopithomyces chartarum]
MPLTNTTTHPSSTTIALTYNAPRTPTSHPSSPVSVTYPTAASNFRITRATIPSGSKFQIGAHWHEEYEDRRIEGALLPPRLLPRGRQGRVWVEVAAAAAAGAHVVRYVYLDCAGGGGVYSDGPFDFVTHGNSTPVNNTTSKSTLLQFRLPHKLPSISTTGYNLAHHAQYKYTSPMVPPTPRTLCTTMNILLTLPLLLSPLSATLLSPTPTTPLHPIALLPRDPRIKLDFTLTLTSPPDFSPPTPTVQPVIRGSVYVCEKENFEGRCRYLFEDRSITPGTAPCLDVDPNLPLGSIEAADYQTPTAPSSPPPPAPAQPPATPPPPTTSSSPSPRCAPPPKSPPGSAP